VPLNVMEMTTKMEEMTNANDGAGDADDDANGESGECQPLLRH
jgi:hypothetical protein